MFAQNRLDDLGKLIAENRLAADPDEPQRKRMRFGYGLTTVRLISSAGSILLTMASLQRLLLLETRKKRSRHCKAA